MKSRKPEELKIDFQISKESKQKDENIQTKNLQETVKKEIINFENEEQKIEEELDEVKLENSENNGKKVRYEDGTWKFF